MYIQFEWEIMDGSRDSQHRTFRAKVIGGWIVRSCFIDEDFGTCESSVFVSDPKHEWRV